MQSTGSWTVLRGRKFPIGLKTKLGHRLCKTAVTFSMSSLGNWCYAQKASRFTLCSKTEIKLQHGASLLTDIVILLPPMSSLKMVRQSFDSRSQRRRDLDLPFLANWATIYVSCFLSLHHKDICSEQGTNGNLESNNICWLMLTHQVVLSAVKSSEISWIIIDPCHCQASENHYLSP